MSRGLRDDALEISDACLDAGIHFAALGGGARARVQRGIVSITDAAHAVFELLTLEECNEDVFLDVFVGAGVLKYEMKF